VHQLETHQDAVRRERDAGAVPSVSLSRQMMAAVAERQGARDDQERAGADQRRRAALPPSVAGAWRTRATGAPPERRRDLGRQEQTPSAGR